MKKKEKPNRLSKCYGKCEVDILDELEKAFRAWENETIVQFEEIDFFRKAQYILKKRGKCSKHCLIKKAYKTMEG